MKVYKKTPQKTTKVYISQLLNDKNTDAKTIHLLLLDRSLCEFLKKCLGFGAKTGRLKSVSSYKCLTDSVCFQDDFFKAPYST